MRGYGAKASHVFGGRHRVANTARRRARHKARQDSRALVRDALFQIEVERQEDVAEFMDMGLCDEPFLNDIYEQDLHFAEDGSVFYDPNPVLDDLLYDHDFDLDPFS